MFYFASCSAAFRTEFKLHGQKRYEITHTTDVTLRKRQIKKKAARRNNMEESEESHNTEKCRTLISSWTIFHAPAFSWWFFFDLKSEWFD